MVFMPYLISEITLYSNIIWSSVRFCLHFLFKLHSILSLFLVIRSALPHHLLYFVTTRHLNSEVKELWIKIVQCAPRVWCAIILYIRQYSISHKSISQPETALTVPGGSFFFYNKTNTSATLNMQTIRGADVQQSVCFYWLHLHTYAVELYESLAKQDSDLVSSGFF